MSQRRSFSPFSFLTHTSTKDLDVTTRPYSLLFLPLGLREAGRHPLPPLFHALTTRTGVTILSVTTIIRGIRHLSDRVSLGVSIVSCFGTTGSKELIHFKEWWEVGGVSESCIIRETDFPSRRLTSVPINEE